MNKYKRVCINAILLATSGFAFAEPQPASVDLSGFTLTPMLEVEEKYNSNILYNENDEIDSLLTIVSPSLQLALPIGVNQYSVQAAVQAGIYNSSSDDNYLDSLVRGDIHHEFTRRNKIDINAQYNLGHQDRGTGYSQGNASAIKKPDRYHSTSLGGDYLFGGSDAIGRIKLSANAFDVSFDNNSAFTRGRDRTDLNFGVTFFYQIQPKSALLFEIKHSQIDYDLSAVTLDSTESRYLLGAEWAATAMTSGSVRAGLLQKQFEDAEREDFTGFSWEIGAAWSPLSYTRFNINTSGKTEETNGTGDFVESKSVSGNWQHNWTNTVSTTVNSFVTKNDYKPSTQKEGIILLSASIGYDIRRWLTFTFGAAHSRRLSNQSGQDFKKNEIEIGLKATL